jgi:signal transduction histidine kinase
VTGSKASRRDSLNHLAVLRGATTYHPTALRFHAVLAVVALLLVLPSRHAVIAVPLALIGLSGPMLNFLVALHDRGRLRRVSVLAWITASTERQEGKHQLNVPALLEIAGTASLSAAFSWVADDLAPTVRLVGLLVAVMFTTSVAHAIYSDHAWYNPDETSPPRWHELLRRASGVSTAAFVGVLALPGHWSPAERAAVAVIAALPVMVGVRIRDLDSVIAVLPEIAEQEHRLGHDLVVAETERALARPLAELTQLAAEHAQEAPVLLMLATHARSRLTDSLTVVEEPDRRLPDVDELLGPVLTLARAIGVAVHVDVAPEALTDSAQPTVVWVLRDLVGNAINAEATRVEVAVTVTGSRVSIAVTDDARPMPLGVWKSSGTSSARLERHLIMLEGSLDVHPETAGKVVTAEFLDR